MHPAGPPRPGTVPWEHCGAGDRCAPRPGGPQLPSPCVGTRELGGTRAQPWGHGEGVWGLCTDPALRLRWGVPAPPASCPSPQHVPIPSTAGPRGGGRAPAAGGSPTAWASPQCCGGAPHPVPQHRAPLQHTRGGGQHAVPPGRPQAALRPRDRTPVLQGTGWGRTLLYRWGCWGGGTCRAGAAPRAPPRAGSGLGSPAYGRQSRSYLPFMKPSRTRSLRSESQ